MPPLYRTDVLIFGGGIAGLWALHRLRREGFKAALVERDELGAGQTLASQGMIHGGQKYGCSRAQEIVARMPPLWDDCLDGKGEVDLQGTQVLQDCQHLWTPSGLLGNCVGALGSRFTHNPTVRLKETTDWPEVLRASAGRVYRLGEKVLDVKSVIESLRKPFADRVYKAALVRLVREGGRIEQAVLASGEAQAVVAAKYYVFCAGLGNEEAARHLGLPLPATKRRPLAQVLVRPLSVALYGHCLGLRCGGPRLTVTSHPQPDGTFVWYLGGGPAEKGARLGDVHAVEACSRELSELFPSIRWADLEWALYRVDRAEPHARFRSYEPTCRVSGNACLAWPVKMTLAPELAARIRSALDAAGVRPGSEDPLLPLPHPEVGKYPWQRSLTWERIGAHA